MECEKAGISSLDDAVRDIQNQTTKTGREQIMDHIKFFNRNAVSSIKSRIPQPNQEQSINSPTKVLFLLRWLVSLPITHFPTLLPRFLKTDGLRPAKKAHITAFLDALRGWACMVVVSHHWNPLRDEWIFRLPIFSMFDRGPGIVHIFFVTSGYVLAYKPLKLMRTRQGQALLDTAASSIFRRWIRLYTSAALATLVAVAVIQLGWTWEDLKLETLHLQLWDWFTEFVAFSNVFSNLCGYYSQDCFSNKYLTTMWTIPVQFRGSMVIFLFCVGTCKLTSRDRMLLCGFLVALCYYWSTIYIALFLGGILLADLAYTREPERLGHTLPTTIPLNTPPASPKTSATIPRAQSRAETVFYSVTALFAIFLISQAEEDFQKAGWPWLALDYIVPPGSRNELMWPSVGALLLVWSLDSCRILQTPFKTNFSRYLGDLSFGVYAMHLPVLWTLSANITDPIRSKVLGDGVWTYIPLIIVNMIAVLWAADLYTKVDDNVIVLGRLIQDKFFKW